MQRNSGLAILGAVTVLVVVAVFFVPPIAQDPAYHDFADKRSWLGVPHFGNVMSNLPFILVGVLGLLELKKVGYDRNRFADPREGIAYAVCITGIGLVGFGSAYYHLDPANAALVWDRLPIALATMALVAMMVAERIQVRAGLILLPVLLILGGASVAYWHFTEVAGHGDLRPYGLILFYPFPAILLMLTLFPARYTGVKYLAAMLAWLVVSRIMELFDWRVFQLTGDLISGHTLKHLTAAVGCYELVRYIRNRRLPAAGNMSYR